MANAEHYQKPVVTASSGELVGEVAERMAREAVGCVVVVGADGRPLGLLTDRDLCVRVVAEHREAGSTPAAAVMTQPAVGVSPDAPLEEILSVMSEHAIRRVVVVRDGELAGLVSLDDVLVALGGELRDLGAVARIEIRGARRSQRLRHLRAEVEGALERCLERAEALGEQAQSAIARELESVRDALRKRD